MAGAWAPHSHGVEFSMCHFHPSTRVLARNHDTMRGCGQHPGVEMCHMHGACDIDATPVISPDVSTLIHGLINLHYRFRDDRQGTDWHSEVTHHLYTSIDV